MAVWAALEGAEEGEGLWLDWSAKDPADDPAVSAARWAHSGKSPPVRAGAGKLFAMAGAASPGWRRPSALRGESGEQKPNGEDHAPEPEPETDARSDGHGAPQPGRILTGADFIARHVPPVWLIDGIVQRSRLYACTSLTGHGKTAVWLFNACMIHAGRMIGQLDVFQGNVLILAGENPADLEARMIGMA